jgi:hypothetical protein
LKNKRKKGLKRNPEVVILSRVKDLGPGKETSKLKPGFVKYLIHHYSNTNQDILVDFVYEQFKKFDNK